jgi:hypothetical protein
MKKVFALFVIASAFTFAACGGKKTEGAEGADTTAVVDTLAPATEMTADTAAADTAAKADTAAAPATEAPAAH